MKKPALVYRPIILVFFLFLQLQRQRYARIGSLMCLGIAIFLYGFSLPGVAEVYQWKDENGQIVFGDKPPNDVQEVKKREVDIDTPSATRALPAQGKQYGTEKMLDYYEEVRQQRKQEKEKVAEKRAAQRAKCEQARKRLQTLEEGGIFYHKGKNNSGERKYYSDQEVAAMKKKLTIAVKRACN